MLTVEKIVKTLARQGYKSDKPTAENVKAFMAAKNIDLNDADGNPIDVDAVFAAEAEKSTKSRNKVTIDPGDEIEDKQESTAAETLRLAQEVLKSAHAAARGSNPPGGQVPSTSMATLEAKSYNAKAAKGLTALPDADAAAMLGSMARLAITRDGAARNYKNLKADRELVAKANVTYDFASGGFAVPEILRPDMINLRLRYSALDMFLPSMPIDAAGETIPRRTSGVTVYSTTEGGTAITESTANGDQVRLQPINMSALSYASNKWLAASAIRAGDWIANEMVYAVNAKEETCYFLGDGTSTYFNISGLLGKVQDDVVDAGGTWTTNAEYSPACVRAAGATWASVTMGNLLSLIGQPGDLENLSGEGLAILCSRQFYYAVFVRLMLAQGGVTFMETSTGQRVPQFMGHPIYFTNALPRASAASSVCCWFGDFRAASKRGNVPELFMLESNPNVAWTSNRMAFKISSERAITVHDIGTSNATATSQVAGPVSFLITTA